MIYEYNILTQSDEIASKRAEDIPKQVIINGNIMIILTGEHMEDISN
jgi:hypothetical protein